MHTTVYSCFETAWTFSITGFSCTTGNRYFRLSKHRADTNSLACFARLPMFVST